MTKTSFSVCVCVCDTVAARSWHWWPVPVSGGGGWWGGPHEVSAKLGARGQRLTHRSSLSGVPDMLCLGTPGCSDMQSTGESPLNFQPCLVRAHVIAVNGCGLCDVTWGIQEMIDLLLLLRLMQPNSWHSIWANKQNYFFNHTLMTLMLIQGAVVCLFVGLFSQICGSRWPSSFHIISLLECCWFPLWLWTTFFAATTKDIEDKLCMRVAYLSAFCVAVTVI